MIHSEKSRVQCDGHFSSSPTLLYRLKSPDGHYVSEFSKWEEDVWQFSKEVSINWRVSLPDGTYLTDDSNTSLLDLWKRVVDSCLNDCRSGKPISVQHAPSLMSGIRRIVEWMVRRHHANLSTLDRTAFEEFIDDWIASFLSGKTDDELDEFDDTQSEDDSVEGFGPLYKVVNVWSRLWGQSPALEEIGLSGLPEDPLEGMTSLKFTKTIFDFIRKSIPQLPDEVAIPAMNEAHRWIEHRADDIIRLLEYCMKFVSKSDDDEEGGARLTYSGMIEFGDFIFSNDPETGEPWYEPVRPYSTVSGKKRKHTHYWVPVQQVRVLMCDLLGACTITIQSESGIRMGELRSLPASGRLDSESHSTIVVKRSISGMTELYFMRSLLKKGHPSPIQEEWLAGARPIGSTFVPGPVKAIWCLQKLFDSWRSMAPSEVGKWLLVNMRSSHSLPLNGTSIVHSSAWIVRNAQRNFISRNVDLSSLPNKSELGEDLSKYRETKGQCLQTYQWRKSYAMYVIRTDRRMKAAVATQFKHASVAITEDAYFSNNPDLLRERNSQQSRAAAGFMYRRIVGEEPCAGRVAKLFDKYADVIREVIGDTSNPEGIKNLQEWCERRNIRVFFSPPGKCFIPIAPLQSECHKVAGTLHWSVKEPNYRTREPDLCAGCACFGIDREHSDFWIDRYVENATAWRDAKQSELSAGFRVIRRRAEVAENILRLLGIELPRLPARSPSARSKL
ncbi:hypothetical protein [Paraburkholderia kirstenboschensis]|uniref:Integrase n=1 Tax=Paraburkholderia kirstenboschensis TaxID=1245436 RepID=A0ABZ0EK52_9BURK|nr:hypothetical protein [Paraburkholderia kirstenboschensis]WOD16955.1 hypothetical protein RW095_13915 [Paraburkholderia kirstenboschensis]